MSGRLFVVATPIGNLEDITLRALRTLRECDVVCCEDTRVTAKLLARYEIAKTLERLDAHTIRSSLKRVLNFLRGGKLVAYVSDAGTPGVSDPGSLLVAAVARELPEVCIESIPGPSALTALVSVAGIRVDRFLFLGFLPLKKHRREIMRRIAESIETVIFYESPHRIIHTLRELSVLLGDRSVVVGRELTKIHETIYRGTSASIADALAQGAVKGEIVVAVAGRK